MAQAHLPQISVAELQAKPNAYVLDVRGDGEWSGGHIECAQHIMAGDVLKRLGEVDRSREVHVVCGSGYRSSAVASLLLKNGFPAVLDVAGGMAAWNHRGLPVTHAAGATCVR